MRKIIFLGAILLGLCVLSQNPNIIIKKTKEYKMKNNKEGPKPVYTEDGELINDALGG